MFVPLGYVTWPEAAIRLAEARQPEAEVRAFLEKRPDDCEFFFSGDMPIEFTPANAAAADVFRALQAAKVALRQAAGDGVLRASAID